ncbi:hypothetical protein EH220_04310 [bacterium]|nr:MAG: hypothetical protein EH220_04310 [bacterium]
MNSIPQKSFHRQPWQRILVFALILLTAAMISACRDKTSIGPEPTPNPTGTWSLRLIYDGVHLESTNDTISVRVYDTNGILTGGATIQSTNVADSLQVSPTVVTTADTISSPWGTQIPLVYWGFNSTVTFDTVFCKAFVNGVEVADTMAIFTLISDF